MALRLIETVTNGPAHLMAKVYRDAEWQEYRVRHYVDGTLQRDADYHTTDKAEAQGHARSFAWYRPKTAGHKVTLAEGV